jgi:hypothetical protein
VGLVKILQRQAAAADGKAAGQSLALGRAEALVGAHIQQPARPTAPMSTPSIIVRLLVGPMVGHSRYQMMTRA